MPEQEKLKKSTEATTAIKKPEDKIDISRRYFALGMFTTVFLFKKNLISPSYQISRTGKYTFKFTLLLFKVFKFLFWTAKKK